MSKIIYIEENDDSNNKRLSDGYQNKIELI